MSLYRKTFLVWWTFLALFIAVTVYINWDMVPSGNQAVIGFTVMILALTSWVPWSFRWRRQEQNCS
jgi:hypothetical protein